MALYKVEGMTCQHCVNALTKALATVEGVTRVCEVSLARGEALLEGSATDEAVLRAVHAEGYRARRAG